MTPISHTQQGIKIPLNISTPLSNYTCNNLPAGFYIVDSFATYPERQHNPTQKDILTFNITSLSTDYITGTTTLPNSTKLYPFTASCRPRIYKGIHEVILEIWAPSESGLNNCSGIYNFYSNTTPFDPAMYLGAPSLETGDPDYNPCEGGRYGTVNKKVL